ncbi:tape measure protein [Sedimenticola hydrogenitrophicus]|uniref:tape measure protein n=1 Tax=Sedimenticola hydrogenitrophicus TaxID=2967975 RepID=UPI0023B08302|nr:tape measure protein [Sedimenticola hydrogenitrophicus]
MADLNLALKIAIAQTGLDNVSSLVGELKKAGVETDKFEQEAADLGAELKKLGSDSGMISAFRKLKTETQGAEQAMAAAKDKTAALSRELKATEAPTKKQQAAFERSRKAARAAAQAYENNRLSLQNMRSQMQQAGIATTNLAEHQVRLHQTQDALTRRGQALAKSLKSTAWEARSSASAIDTNAAAAGRAAKSWGTLRTAAAAAGGFLVAKVGISTITSLLRNLRNSILAVSETGGKFEALRVQMDTLFRSNEKGGAAVEWIKTFTAKTPYQLDQVTQSFIKLKAMGMDPMDGSFRAIADQASSLGAKGETLEGIVLALGQAWSKQKLQGEEALQLIERGVPVWDLLAKATGRNAAELQEMSAKGLLGRDAIRALMDEMGRNNLGASERAMRTLNGQLSNLKDNWTNFLNLIADQGALAYFKGELESLNQKFAEWAKNGELKKWAREAAETIISLGGSIRSTIETVASMSGAFKFAGNAIAFFWNSIQITIKGIGSLFLDTAALITLGLSKITFGDLSKQYEAEAKKLSATAAGLRDGIITDAREARAALLGMGEAAGLVSEEVVKGQEEVAASTEKTKAALTETEQAAQAAAEKAQALADAYKELGIETEESLRQTGQATVDAFRQIVESGTSGVNMLNAFDAALKKAGDAQTINALKIALYDAFDTGKISLDAYLKRMDEVDKRLGAIGETVQNSEEAFNHFGLTSVEALQKIADKSREMFDALEQSGQATTEQLAAAFLKYAEDAIRAQDGVIDKQLKAKAAALGLTTEIRVLAEQYKQTGAFGREAFRIAAHEARALRDAINEINQATTRSELADLANEAARRWREGKISAKEYGEIIDEINLRRRELIKLTEEQVTAEQQATEAAGKTAEQIERQASGKARAGGGKKKSAGGGGGETYTRQEIAWVGGAKDLIRRDLAAAGIGGEIVAQTLAQFDKEIKDPSNLRGLNGLDGYKKYYDFLLDRANSAIRNATATARREQRQEQANRAGSASESTAQPGKTITMVFKAAGGRAVAGTFAEGDAQGLLDVLAQSGAVTE